MGIYNSVLILKRNHLKSSFLSVLSLYMSRLMLVFFLYTYREIISQFKASKQGGDELIGIGGKSDFIYFYLQGCF